MAEERLEHVIVLMMENRSFDHMLGFLDHPRPDEFVPLQPNVFFNEARDHTRVFATVGEAALSGPDPQHSHAAAKEQLGSFGSVPTNGGFVVNYEAAGAPGGRDGVMNCLKPEEQCPVLAELAKEFAVCTAWFSSVPGETWPNRNFLHAATSDGTVDIELGFYYDPTIFELIAKRKRTWRIYHDGPPEVWAFRRLWRGRTLLDFLLRRKPKVGNWFPMTSFFAHVVDQKLPTYTFIEPAHNRIHDPKRQTNSQHPHNNVPKDGQPNPSDFLSGEQLIKAIYQSLRAQPDLFARTLVVILYDEHGGFYDHVAPPTVVPPADPVWRGFTRRIGRLVRRIVNMMQRRPPEKRFDFASLGVRVPAVLISPWIERGTVVTKPLEHASVPRTLREVFAGDMPPLTKRDQAANPFHDVVLQSPRQAPRRPGEPGSAPAADLLPDLDGLAAPVPGPVAPRAVAPAAAAATEPPEPTVAEAIETDELDRQLLLLDERVRQRLERSPSVLLRRLTRRAPAPRRRRVLRAPAPEAPRPPTAPVPDTVAMFEDVARRARRG